MFVQEKTDKNIELKYNKVYFEQNMRHILQQVDPSVFIEELEINLWGKLFISGI